jgi:endonuclease/exonuclease/phosphatase family metal-dependent hydrolase
MDRIRVATLNIWNRLGPWEDRLIAIHKEIERVQPDILGLQEVLVIPEYGFDQGNLVAEPFDYHVAYGRSPDGVSTTIGNAILSRWPITRTVTFGLPGTDERRSLVFAEIDSPAGKIPFFTTHLNWRFSDGAVRELQVQTIARFIHTLAPADGYPPILVGDFNADADSGEIRFLRGVGTLSGRSVHFTDAFAHVGEGPGITFSKKNSYAAHLREPERRIDYVFVRGGDERFRGEPLSARVCFETPVDDAFPSDHFGVLAELRV